MARQSQSISRLEKIKRFIDKNLELTILISGLFLFGLYLIDPPAFNPAGKYFRATVLLLIGVALAAKRYFKK